jgi:hypothetical protein
MMRTMVRILMHFSRWVDSTGAGQNGCVDRAGTYAARHYQADFRPHTQCVMTQRCDRVIELIDYL